MSNTVKKFTIYDMAVIGVMAAICFVVTYFIKIEFPTPAGPVMLKLANAFCLLAGMLFGGVRGGLAAGIGSMLYDLMDPKYITDAPFTLIRFFLMAFICGIICFSKMDKGNQTLRNIIGATAGSLFSVAFYFTQSIIKQLLLGQPFNVAILNIIPKMGTSLINAVIAVVIASLLAPILKNALKRAGLYQKINVKC
ncbi:MAG: ECF transporter S component [Oscillospiraceae bacterium]